MPFPAAGDEIRIEVLVVRAVRGLGDGEKVERASLGDHLGDCCSWLGDTTLFGSLNDQDCERI